MLKKMNKKGFTLAELLIVVAIIAVLVAISIPIFSAQLEKAKEATDMANIRSAYAEVVTAYLGDPKKYTISVDLKSNTEDYVSDQNAEIAGVKYSEILKKQPGSSGTAGPVKTCIVEIDENGKVKIGGMEAKTSKLK